MKRVLSVVMPLVLLQVPQCIITVPVPAEEPNTVGEFVDEAIDFFGQFEEFISDVEI